MVERVAGRSGRGDLRTVPEALTARLPRTGLACGTLPASARVHRMRELKLDIMHLESTRALLDAKIRYLRRLQGSIVS